MAIWHWCLIAGFGIPPLLGFDRKRRRPLALGVVILFGSRGDRDCPGRGAREAAVVGTARRPHAGVPGQGQGSARRRRSRPRPRAWSPRHVGPSRAPEYSMLLLAARGCLPASNQCTLRTARLVDVGKKMPCCLRRLCWNLCCSGKDSQPDAQFSSCVQSPNNWIFEFRSIFQHGNAVKFYEPDSVLKPWNS